VTNSLGSRILEMQKELLNKEIKNILYGFADCLMYKTGQVSPAGMLFPPKMLILEKTTLRIVVYLNSFL
jgi:hypothetical protein